MLTLTLVHAIETHAVCAPSATSGHADRCAIRTTVWQGCWSRWIAHRRRMMRMRMLVHVLVGWKVDVLAVTRYGVRGDHDACWPWYHGRRRTCADKLRNGACDDMVGWSPLKERHGLLRVGRGVMRV